MRSRVRAIIILSSVSFLVLVALGRDAATISLSNDVDVGASDLGTFLPCSSAQCRVVGAPRLIASPHDVDLNQLRVKIAVDGNMPSPSWVALSVFRFPSLRPVLGFNGPLQLILNAPSDLSRPFELSQFENYDDFVRTVGSIMDGLLFTVSARFPFPVGFGAIIGTATITLSGPGQWVAFDVLGAPGAVDGGIVPTRSMEIARALIQLEGRVGQHPAVDLGVDGIDRPVGFTHIFALSADTRIQGATLQLSLTSNDPLFSTDFILLDAAVRRAAIGQQGVPLIALSHLHFQPKVPNPGESASVTVDLSRVPVVIDPPPPGVPFSPEPDAEVNLLRQLRDGRLNVIVGDDSTVNGSLLTIYLRDS